MKYFFDSQVENALVKICGVTNQADAAAAIDAGADALGFNFYRHGKRFLDLEIERSWIGELPPEIARFALMVDLPIEEATFLMADDLFDAVQLHGEETPSYCHALAKIGKPIIKALRVRHLADLEEGRSFPVFALLCDSFVEHEKGGTGQSFDWKLFAEVELKTPIILAGGLTPDNVAEAIRVVHPYAVDVASGVESSPRRKDKTKMRDFIQAAKNALK